MKTTKVYSLDKNYRKLEIWHCAESGERFMRRTIRPVAGLNKRDRYGEIYSALKSENIPVPPFAGCIPL